MTLNARFIKVRLLDGTLDVRLLRVSDSTIRIHVDVARGEDGEWAGGPSLAPFMWAADVLFLCGS